MKFSESTLIFYLTGKYLVKAYNREEHNYEFMIENGDVNIITRLRLVNI